MYGSCIFLAVIFLRTSSVPVNMRDTAPSACVTSSMCVQWRIYIQYLFIAYVRSLSHNPKLIVKNNDAVIFFVANKYFCSFIQCLFYAYFNFCIWMRNWYFFCLLIFYKYFTLGKLIKRTFRGQKSECFNMDFHVRGISTSHLFPNSLTDWLAH